MDTQYIIPNYHQIELDDECPDTDYDRTAYLDVAAVSDNLDKEDKHIGNHFNLLFNAAHMQHIRQFHWFWNLVDIQVWYI